MQDLLFDGHPALGAGVDGSIGSNMSISAAQRRQNSAEILARQSLLVTDEALAAGLGLNASGLQALLESGSVDRAGVWRVRDFLVAVAGSKGFDVPDFSVIKDSRRTDAVGWFGTWDVPDVASL